MGLNVDDKKRERSSDYMNMNDAPPELNFNPQLFKDTNSLSLNQKQLNYNGLDDLRGDKFGHEKFRNIYKDELLMDQNIVHSHEKKW